MAIAWMNPKAIKFATIHCAATPAGRDVKAPTISKWDQDKFGQTSYHYVIELDGTTVQTLRHDQRGAHTGGHNTGNIGICYVGGVDAKGKVTDTRTPAQKVALETLVRKLRAQYPTVRIMGHRDWSPDKDGDGVIEPFEWLKGCPSFDVAAWLKTIGL